MTSVRSERQISWLFRDFKPKSESWKELTNSYFFPIISYFPPIAIIEITTGPSGQQMIFLFSQVSISVGGGRKTPTQSKKKQQPKNTHD